MAKRINILSAGGTIPYADNGLKLSKSIKISEIEYHEEFKSLFTIDNDLLQRIINSIKENKYDNSQPVHIWVYTDDEGITHNYLIDGHTRLQAAKEAGLETIPYFEHKFDSFEEAYKYVLGLQVNRRNLAGSELLRNISKLYGTDFIQNYEGKKSEAIAELIGKSDRTVEKGIYVNKNADEETLEKIDTGKLSVDKAYKQLKKQEKNTETDFSEDFNPFDDMEEISESLEDNSGNPRPISFMQRKPAEPKMTPEEDNERTLERKRAYEGGFTEGFKKGFAEGSYRVYDKIIGMLHEGKTVEDIENDDIFADFTFSEIAPKFDIQIKDEELLKTYKK